MSDLQIKEDYQNSEPIAEQPDLQPKGIHQIIWDEDQVRKFFQIHMAEFMRLKNTDYTFLVLLIARRKYHPSMSTTDTNFPRKTMSCFCRSEEQILFKEEEFIRMLRNYEVAQDLYRDKRTDEILPTSSLALYVVADPLLDFEAWIKTQTEMQVRTQQMIKTLQNPQPNSQILRFNVESIFKDKLHASPSKLFRKLDIDTKDPEQIKILQTLFQANKIKPSLIIESKNGFHVILRVKYDPLGNKKEILSLENLAHQVLHKFITDEQRKIKKGEDCWVSIEKNGMIIIPGTLQGGFKTRIVEW